MSSNPGFVSDFPETTSFSARWEQHVPALPAEAENALKTALFRRTESWETIRRTNLLENVSQATQRDLAALLGMNQSSVSRALHGDQRISSEVRARVLAAAAELGYEPDPVVTMFARYRWKEKPAATKLSVALLSSIPEPRRTGFLELRQAVEKSGYLLNVINVNTIESPRALIRILKARGVSGVLLFISDGVPVKSAVMEVCKCFPAVSWNTRLLDPPCPCVVRDAYHRVADCCQAMTRRKVERAMIVIPANLDEPMADWVREMHAAWLYHRQGHPRWSDPVFVTYQEKNWDQLAARLRANPPDALIACTEDIIFELKKRGVALGGEIAFACMDVKAGRSWSGIQTLFPEVARRCVELLDGMIANREVGRDRAWIQVVVRGQWIDGTSL